MYTKFGKKDTLPKFKTHIFMSLRYTQIRHAYKLESIY